MIWLIAIVWLFFGFTGLHRFLMKRYSSAVIRLCLFIIFIWAASKETTNANAIIGSLSFVLIVVLWVLDGFNIYRYHKKQPFLFDKSWDKLKSDYKTKMNKSRAKDEQRALLRQSERQTKTDAEAQLNTQQAESKRQQSKPPLPDGITQEMRDEADRQRAIAQKRIDEEFKNKTEKQPASNHSTDNTALKTRLTEIIEAIIADNLVSIEEVHFLIKWIDKHQTLQDTEVVNLNKVLNKYAKDDWITETEEADLLKRFRTWLGKKPTNYTKQPTHIDAAFATPTNTWIGLTIRFDYTAATGEQTNRTAKISVEKSDGNVGGYCLHAKSYRTFKKSRMDNVIDIDTGEILQR